MRHVVDEERSLTRHPIRPEHIDAESHFWSAFGHAETEVSANWVVRLLQSYGGGLWRPFSQTEIETFYNAKGFENFSFNRLVDGTYGFVILGEDGRYRVTHEFICRVLAASPRAGLPFSVLVRSDTAQGATA